MAPPPHPLRTFTQNFCSKALNYKYYKDDLTYITEKVTK